MFDLFQFFKKNKDSIISRYTEENSAEFEEKTAESKQISESPKTKTIVKSLLKIAKEQEQEKIDVKTQRFITRTTINRNLEKKRTPEDDKFVSELHGELFESKSPDPMDLYLKDIAKHPLLTKEEEYKYGILARNGDMGAKNKMMNGNLRLVVKIARRYLNSGMSVLDLIEEGNLGLMRAIEKFEPERGFRFSTYGAWWIQQNIERAIMSQNRTIRLPVHVAKKINSMLRKTRNASKDLEHEPTSIELSEKIGLSTEDIENLNILNEKIISLNSPVSNDIDKTLIETIGDEEINPLLEVSQDNLKDNINAWLKKLNESQRAVIERRFGLNMFEPTTLEQTGKEIGFTRERVRQLQTEALKILKKHIIADGEDFDNLVK